MTRFTLVLSFVGLLGCSGAQFVQDGQCSTDVQLVESFDADQFLGTWYEIRRSAGPTLGDCATVEISRNFDNNYIFTYNAVNRNLAQSTYGVGTLAGGTAKYTLNLDNSNEDTDFWIIATDYDSYALAYSCRNISPTQRSVSIWQLGRSTSNQNLEAEPSNAPNQLGIDIADLETVQYSIESCSVLPITRQEVIIEGQCDPNITVVPNFEVSRFTGLWYEIASYYSDNALGSCNRAQYTLGDGFVNVVNSQVVDQTLEEIRGTASVISEDGSGRLSVTLEVVPGVFATQDLWILATDYDNWGVSYSCTNVNGTTKRVGSWIISRTRTQTEASQQAVDAVIAAYPDLSYEFYQIADQSDEACFYYPEPNPETPVVFRGRCDLNIPAMPNFDAARYLGLWHDIESYPTNSQEGTCNNAFYSLGEGVVDVYNTEIISQRLDTINGTAIVVSDDGTAKLLVTFIINSIPIQFNYWVLDTDYETYALVYTCEEAEDGESRQIFSWKLSRTKQLPESARSTIDNIINTIPVLDQRYYVPRDQSEEGCFYYPEPREGVPVVFPGQCDENIAAVSNFDLEQFAGTWYEIQAYPKDQQSGQCINYQFTAGTGNTLNLQSSSVFDRFLEITSGVLSFSTSYIISARMTITIISRGEPIEIPFWILATDYTDYALAYSCVNIAEDFRAVYSWKLSRTRQQLSAAANTTINNVIANVQVLDNDYYENIDQSDEACSYLAELSPGEPVILSGQCDQNIPVVTNFDAARYLGRWHLVETYPSTFQDGKCNDATYTLTESDSDIVEVSVFNTQVINQTLDTITGEAFLFPSNDSSAKLLVVFPNAPQALEYWILATDYDSYSLVYTCLNLNNEQRQIWSWKLSRTKSLSDNAITAINQVVNSVDVLNNRYYQIVDNSDDACFYYPETNPERPVVFRGQCDLNIPAMPNFDAARYLGLWHDIESYPTNSQEGTCNNAFYSLGEGVVDVYNTEIISQRLDTINGTAIVVSDDGTAKLLVTFIIPVDGIDFVNVFNYWVLDTDYETYALVYTCEESEDGESRQVFSWKLSRTKQLSESARTTIDNIVDTIPVLDQRYYVPRNQSEDGCFYYPEPREGIPVVFPGQCDENIAVVNNFSLAQFAGTWHEIQAYPKNEQSGQCINHQFTAGTGNTLNIQSSSVLDRFLETTSAVLSYSSTDNSAKMTITNISGGQPIEIPFWILATDYNDYALAYSCVNIAEDFRAVYSWKLSRTRQQLSAAANTAINNVIANVQVLDNDYYENIGQSDEACSSLAELTPGEPVIISGQCDQNIPVVTNFDAARYLGLWHLIESYPSAFQDGDCNDATYSLQNDGSVLVYNTQVINQTLDTIFGSASVISSDDGSAKLNVSFPDTPVPLEYWVLATDYESYSLVYTCFNLNSEQRQIWSWKLSRTKSLSDNAIAAINQVVNSVDVLNNRYYKVIDKSDEACFYYPEPNPETPVVFRGQCDLDIPAMPNFDAARYLGLWHDIESYPTNSQLGTCNNAYYSLGDGVVDVYNTEVINQLIDSINGTAIVVSEDGSAKLLVTFIILGFPVQFNYWVLDTDYETYALVYTCEESEDGENIQIFSWKLSRTKQLPESARTTIDNIIDTIPVLDSRYYVPRNQSEEGCFYYPEPREGVPVVFPGQCDESIAVVNNFDLAQFAGTWHEIQAYPKSEQSGQCINHQFTAGTGNTLDLQSSSVFDRFLERTSGVLSYSSTDNSARMTITIISGGQPIEIPFWILAIDYNDYALAYSCVNIAEDFRAVYSWKMSRTRQQLSAAANTAINNVIANVQVLDNDYYENIGQSDEACSSLAELTPGEPVIIPGQCDENIAVVTNFDAVRYLGLWHLIESYPSAFQDGDCNDATYSIQNDGSVLVYNTQVINQTLDTIFGSASVIPSNDGSAKLNVTFPDTPVPLEYWVLATDYESYSLVYTCFNLNSEQRQIWSWKLSRTKSLSDNAIAAIDQVVNSVDVLNNRYYKVIDKSDEACFYYPEPNTETPVVFRGQCDLDIPAMPNFDAARYLGLWHDIESYPTNSQLGTCNNAYYSLGDGVVDVYNTEVISQLIDSINGTAVVVSDDGSAKLLVTFIILGFPIQFNYWVLDTDYETYALVYTCEEAEDGESRQIFSWKLSRTKQLPESARTTIDNIVDTIPVLDQRYYVPRDQSEEGCFYYPEPREGIPVVFPGQCDESIAVVNNFSLDQFAGTWHEIQAYPKNEQSGQCINHQFTAGTGNTLNIQSSSVFDRFLETTSAVLSYSSTDNSAKMTITNISGGQPIEIPFWILATDYTDYALAYSCVNIAEDFRAVYSWKLSRTRQQLSGAANTAINNVISNVQVLDNDYYENIGQSDEACSTLAELTPGEPVIIAGQCDQNIPVVTYLDAARYLGLWHLIESYPSSFQDGDCNDATYSLQNDGSVLVYNTQVINQTLDTIFGSASVIPSNDGSAKLNVTFPDTPEPLEYWVLSTDYESYSLVYSCRNLNNEQRQVWSWKLSRTKSLSDSAIAAINQVVNSVDVLNNRYYEVIDNSDDACFYFPEITPGQAPIFRGQCDESIPVVQNFDVGRYLGQWYDIESYPQQFQEGTCGNALYTLGDGVVDVYNTQVIDQSLDTINGTAVVASEDGSAKLLVTFPIAGTSFTISTSYWVLDTDYDSYSLVYSCENVNSESRRVSSWKLSRTKQLPAAAYPQIDSIVATIPVLDERYYQPEDQSEDGCFYFPEPKEGTPVVFPGQCNENIEVVNNFNLEQFAGTWHEIQAYPKEEQSGKCINHQFTSGAGNTLNIQSSSVIGQFLQTSNGVLSFNNSTDSSARLTITITVNGQNIEIPFYILATDYNDYALAASCVNIADDFRAVYSWKLSRTRQQLSPAANIAINNVIANVQVLDEVYYETIDQSDEGCFFVPEPAPGVPVIFPGQCDPNIPVVTNFDAGRYLGRWHLIESYPSAFQDGECNEATYSLQNDGSVLVYNTQVINQTLDTIFGSASVIPSNDGSAKLNVTFPNAPPLEYWVLDTDYDSYSLVYSCLDIGDNQRQVWSWKLSRTKTLSNNAITAINQVISSVDVLDNDFYEIVDNSDVACFYYPEVILGQSPIFRGQCDENITVVQNFDVERYLGRWYDIESYPQQFQEGTCGTANYSPGNGVVSVFNTQVVNERLDTIEATAVLASDDGSAKLLVTFPIAGTDQFITTPYWVLETDYDNYALVYSCDNVDSETRRVTSWKLSRTKSLSEQATSIINARTEPIDVLDERYYLETGQSDADCFYYPEYDVLPGSTIELPGPCNESIRAKADFDAAAYLGRWFEVARYPTGDQFGECARAEYSLGDGVVDVYNTQVVNEQLLIQEGYAVVASTDGSGLLDVTFVVQGVTVNANYYVMETDYDNYALVYSCRNTSDGNRIVSSWQLSRQRSGISNESAAIINNSIDNTQGLLQDYYINTSQSDDDCFYIPELDESADVIFRGQCENITGVQSFDIQRYLGWWHEIERYPTAAPTGECSSSQFEASGNQFLVVDTSVTDQNGQIDTSVVTATTDGRLRRTLSNGQVIDTWVLATDYETYSLLYSCENIDEEYRRVWSAKHSKARQLTNAAQNAMSPVIENNRVLYPQFYLEVDQGDDACFYYPESTGRPVILPGQCDDNIPVVQNFEAGEYTGTWYQIERYPQTFELGAECTGARYSLDESTGIVTVLNWEVLDGELDTIVGNATITSTDGSAKLEVVLPNRGEGGEGTVITSLYVLTTDYISYSLAYSCVNVNEYQRQLGVWKLSRTRSLPAAGTTAINAYIASRLELNQQYFLQVTHNDDCLEPSSGFLVKSSVLLMLVCALAHFLF